MDDQRTTEWLQARLGHATGSRFKDVIAKLKSGAPAKAREDYMLELAIERLTGNLPDNYVTTAMQWGIDKEPEARLAYIAATDAWVEETGFLRHVQIAAGISPDGLVDEDGGIEIKCPFNSNIHVNTWLNGMPSDHNAQLQGAMWITGRAWWDFVSYDPRMPAGLKLYRQRIERDEKFISMLDIECRDFLQQVDAITTTLKEKITNV